MTFPSCILHVMLHVQHILLVFLKFCHADVLVVVQCNCKHHNCKVQIYFAISLIHMYTGLQFFNAIEVHARCDSSFDDTVMLTSISPVGFNVVDTYQTFNGPTVCIVV
jgi:hypothetical protein